MRKLLLPLLLAVTGIFSKCTANSKNLLLRSLAGLFLVLAGLPAMVYGQTPGRDRPGFFIRFEPGKRPAAANVQQVFKQQLKLGANDQLVRGKSEKDPLGFSHEQYQQHYKGVKVEYGVLKAHVRNGVIESISGEQNPIPEMSVQPGLSESAALQKALAFVGAKSYQWQNAQEEAWIKKEQKNPKATFYPKGELVICRDFLNSPDQEKMVLAFKFDIYATEPLSRAYIYVDASNGKIIHRNAILRDADGTAATRYSLQRTIQTEPGGAGYVLRDASRGNGVETYNLQKSTNFATAIDFTDADNNWTAAEFDNANKDNAALDAHWGAQEVYDYWKNVHGRLGLDNLNGKMKSYVHYGNATDNAYWNGTAMLYGDGNTRFRPLTALDVVAHEFGHGVMQYTADLIYSYEQGALNEGFSDIWGAVIEHYAAPEKQNWLIGEEIALLAPALRSMSNPNSGSPQQPDTYKGTYWFTGSSDNGGVHYNSGVLNFWFYLLSEGKTGTNDNGSNYAVTGIGIDKAAKIAYRTESVYLTSTSNFQDTRAASLLAAIDLFGENSNEVIQTKNAWDAVGLSEPITLTLTSASDTEITLSWQVSSTSITGYEVERSLSSNSGFVTIAPLSGNTTSYTDASLVAGTTYYYRIKATQANGFSYYSPIQGLLLGSTASPTLLTANVIGNTVNLTWQDNSYNETNFLLERSLQSTSGFAPLITLGANTTSYQDNPVANIYYYRVRAYRSDISFYSAYSNTVRAIVGNITIMSNAPVSTCDQLYLDPGGNENYTDNQDFTQTFTPADASRMLRVVFNSFSLESGFDFLNIYDGANTSAPLIGTYAGTTSPGTITAHNPTGQLTFRFTSDVSVTNPGWSATLSCVPGPGPSSSVLSVNGPSTICRGTSANLVVAVTSGVPPYTVVYSDGANNFTVNNYTSGNNIPVSPTVNTSYSLVSVTDAGSYTGTGNSGTPSITVNQPVTWYLDADGDTHYVSTVSSCYSPGAGYTTTGGTLGDCNDGDNSVWQSALLYVDGDGDGYDAGQATICYGATAPIGYSLTTSGTDCDDTNPSTQTVQTWYLDADGDTHYVSSVSSCGTPGTGYNTTGGTLGDCADNNSAVWQSALLYIDVDGDGYDAGQATVCYGASIPAGYRTTTSGTDCNDNNPSAQTAITWYLDADGDTHYVSSVSSCGSPGSGYNTTGGTLDDCNDNNGSVWQSALLYIDIDGDGYDAGQATVCYGASVPAGYKTTTSGTDCNDNVAAINPGAIEICGNNIDDNCNGSIDENCNACQNAISFNTTNISASSAQLNWVASVNPVQWQVQYKTVKQGSKWIDVILTGDKRSVTISSLLVNQNYNWHIRAKCGKNWTSYSAAISFKTLASVPLVSSRQAATTIDEGKAIQLYPNPSRGQFKLLVRLAKSVKANAKIELFSTSGQAVYTSSGFVSNGVLQTTIQVPTTVASGMYVVKVTTDNEVQQAKLVYSKN